MTHEQYMAHWRDVHGPLFASQPDVKRYVRRYAQCHITGDRPTGPNLGETDGIVELWRPDHPISIERNPARIVVSVAGRAIADMFIR